MTSCLLSCTPSPFWKGVNSKRKQKNALLGNLFFLSGEIFSGRDTKTVMAELLPGICWFFLRCPNTKGKMVFIVLCCCPIEFVRRMLLSVSVILKSCVMKPVKVAITNKKHITERRSEPRFHWHSSYDNTVVCRAAYAPPPTLTPA